MPVGSKIAFHVVRQKEEEQKLVLVDYGFITTKKALIEKCNLIIRMIESAL